jgi:methionine sulfoxide reductase catalytic subunit
MGVGAVAAVGGAGTLAAAAPAFADADPSAGFYPAKRNPKYTLDRPLTPKKLSTAYNNFYEFTSNKDVYEYSDALKIRPWSISIDGMVEKPFTLGIDDLLKKVTLEERLYRHRCVETWSMAVPWTGFPLKTLVDVAKPLSGAKYLKMVAFMDPKMAPGQRAFFYPWPYVEGVTMFEANNDLAFLVTGMYGKPVPKQDGAPLRLALPWKYGFKSIKSIVRFTFTDQRPVSFWTALQSNEYGFWANVNPAVPHPRWSQATERELGEDMRRPTLIWNGYGEYVASMYGGIKGEQLFR